MADAGVALPLYVEQQIPSLRCGMTNKRASNNKSNGNRRFLRCAAE
jgi:hypothetical protein